MLEIEPQVRFWRDGAQEDLVVAQELLERGRLRHGLFFLHLALEKLLKAHVCRHTRDLAPRTHNLVRLAEVANVNLSEQQKDILAEINPFALAGRYPDALSPLPTSTEAKTYTDRAKEVFACLFQML